MLNVTAGHSNNSCYWRDPAIVSLPRLARRDTIDSVQLAKHHTRCRLNWTADAGRQAGEAWKERGRMEDGREGARGEWGGREQREGVRKL